ncbi:MAG: DUF4922 domain-containing protein [Muribaculaceae bacterium]|jgi:hypothetical protein|nr:DUF4922 domain-containing protein [Muribaculaceae bacterium]
MPTADKIDTFINAQLAEWPLAAANFKALENVEVKEIDMPGMPMKVQFNPARIVSSGAKVDAASLKARKCFLCDANRPSEQRGIAWGGRYTILVNPFPIFPRHLTIPDNSHTLQLIKGRIADMARLVSELSGYTVFYNGPKCGASAPDHMHFQAGNSDFLTIGDAVENAELQTIAEADGAILSLAAGLPLNVFVIDSTSAESAEIIFDRLYEALPVGEGDTEPMMNVLCYATAAGVRTLVVPRKKHRPSFYGTEGSECMLLSPASVDMGGVFITPRREDFERLDSDIIRRVFDELCLSKDEIDAIAAKLM